MFLTLMLVGYATSKFTDNKTNYTPWHARLLRQKKLASAPAANDDASWGLGAEAWVTIPAQAKER